MNFNNEISALKRSPIFSISLSSKELFHSNFIAWMLVEYPKEMWKIFSIYTSLDYGDYELKTDSIKREYKHIDLMFDVVKRDSIVGKNDLVKIIIENKVKSLPYINQLEDYSKKYPNAENILLSLSTAENIVVNGKVTVSEKGKENAWKLFTYKELANMLCNIDTKNEYETFIINDYINLIKNLSSINDKARLINKDEIYNWYENTDNSLRKIRLDSFVIKLKCENLALKIENSITDNFPNINSDRLTSTSGIVQGTNGEFRIYYEFNDRITISIEVSKYFYRKMVHLKNTFKVKGDKKDIPFETKYEIQNVFDYFKSINWFDFSQIKTQKYKPTKKFLKFGNTTRYLQCKISNKVSINDIINYFIEDIAKVLEFKDEIETEFK